MKEGKIIALTGGLYTVATPAGERVQLRAAGIFRHHSESPKVGDDVDFDDAIRKIRPRRNELVRPAIANVDQALVVTSCREPDFSFLLLDEFLTIVAAARVAPVIVVTKVDLAPPAELLELKRKLAYYAAFCPVVYIDSPSRDGLAGLLPLLAGRTSVLAGQTGAGKSSLLNAVDPALNRAVDAISKALGRGKHTTRTVELLPYAGGWIADTPGFSQLDFTGFDLAKLQDLYPDFTAVAAACRFNGCSHTHEPGCAVKAGLAAGTILPERHAGYLVIRELVRNAGPRY